MAKVAKPKGDSREPIILDAGQYEKLLEACEGRPIRERLQEHAAAFRLQTYDGERSPWVFHHLLTQRGAVVGQSLHRAFASAAKRAKLPSDLRQHDLRHRRVTTWLADGQSPALVQRAMGHSDLATTMGYAHLVDDDLLALVAEDEDEALRELAEGA